MAIGNKTENTHELFEKRTVLMPIRTINSRSFYVMRTHHSSNKVDNFTFVDAKQSIRREKKEAKIAGRKFWNEKNN